MLIVMGSFKVRSLEIIQGYLRDAFRSKLSLTYYYLPKCLRMPYCCNHHPPKDRYFLLKGLLIKGNCYLDYPERQFLKIRIQKYLKLSTIILSKAWPFPWWCQNESFLIEDIPLYQLIVQEPDEIRLLQS